MPTFLFLISGVLDFGRGNSTMGNLRAALSYLSATFRSTLFKTAPVIPFEVFYRRGRCASVEIAWGNFVQTSPGCWSQFRLQACVLLSMPCRS
jgi:hypothetical protein